MLSKNMFSPSRIFFLVSLIIGFILVVDAYRGHFATTRYFVPFLMYIWLPQLVVLGILLLFRPNILFLSGVSLAMDLYLALLTRLALEEGAFWITYLSSFLGVLLGAYAGLMFLRIQNKKHWSWVLGSGLAGTGLGILAGFLLLVRM